MKLKRCPFCGGEAEYSEKEERIECGYCKARVWFEGLTDLTDEEKWKKKQIDGWENRFENASLANRLYEIADRRDTEYRKKLWNLAKYGELAAELERSKRLILEIKEEFDGVDINASLLDSIEKLDRPQVQAPE